MFCWLHTHSWVIRLTKVLLQNLMVKANQNHTSTSEQNFFVNIKSNYYFISITFGFWSRFVELSDLTSNMFLKLRLKFLSTPKWMVNCYPWVFSKAINPNSIISPKVGFFSIPLSPIKVSVFFRPDPNCEDRYFSVGRIFRIPP